MKSQLFNIASFTADYDDLLVVRVKTLVTKGENERRLLLNIGAGTGELLVKLATALDDPCLTFLGIDRSDDMVAAARRNVAQAGLRRISILQEDVHHMSFPASFASVILNRSALHHWRNPVEALREIYRVLRPGGVAVIHDVRRDAPAEFVKLFQPGDFDEKLTPAEVEQIVSRSLPHGCATITAPTDGPASLGFELLIRKVENGSSAPQPMQPQV